MDIAAFRTRFPEFSNTVTYPDAFITPWANVAEKLVVEDVWGECYNYGVMLYVAHELTLQRVNVAASQVGGTPGLSGGIANSKTVGSVSVSYDSVTASEKDAGWWNLSNYGKQFIRLARIFGAGVNQL